MVHSVSGWMRGVQVKLWDPLRTRAIPERLRGAFTTRCYTNPRLPVPLRLAAIWRNNKKINKRQCHYTANLHNVDFKNVIYRVRQEKLSCCTAGCNCISYAPIQVIPLSESLLNKCSICHIPSYIGRIVQPRRLTHTL